MAASAQHAAAQPVDLHEHRPRMRVAILVAEATALLGARHARDRRVADEPVGPLQHRQLGLADGGSRNRHPETLDLSMQLPTS